ncbi:MAG TPA: extracellular solute-binding protein [Candidatus Baltobacteraceae bacterium]|nr:extracellular solute-binding protein [Candidatus Baltobacteraceae bacterium]
MNRREWIAAGAGLASAALIAPANAQPLTVLDVAYAGSMGSMMEGPVKTAVVKSLGVDIHGRAQGSDALAQLIVSGTIAADVFVPVTPGPMRTVLGARKVKRAIPIARTEMVIAYSPKSPVAASFVARPWYEVLQQPGVRFGRTDPATDPQGRNIIFTLQLAELYYDRPGLAQKILGETINPAQIFAEGSVEARLQSGELDAASAYKTQPGPFGLPFVRLPDEINLGNQSMSVRYAHASLELNGKSYHPQALVYYAAAIEGSRHAAKAQAFVNWFSGPEAKAILTQYAYDPPTGASILT